MCGRFNVTDDPVTIALLKYFGVYLNIKPRLPLYNMAPTEPIPIILEKSGERMAKFAVWWFLLKMTEKGLAPNTAVTTFNARAQKMNSSRMWKKSYKKFCCIIPASSWLKYLPTRSVKIPNLIKSVDAAIAFAGLYREWRYKDDTIYSCSLMTTNHHPKFYHIYRKSFLVILYQESFGSWLDPKFWDTEHFEPLFEPRLRTDFEVVGTDPKYNRPTNKNPKCTEPTGKPELIPADEVI